MLEGTAQPPDELQRRHEVEAPLIDGAVLRPFWRLLPRFDQLYTAQRITDAGYKAGCCWRHDYVLVNTLTMPQPALDRIPGGGGGSWCPPFLILESQRRLRESRAIVNDDGWALLIFVLTEDRSWRSLAQLYESKAEAVQDAFILLINALEPVYANTREPE
jgi:hypothetical protein